jgi:Domain of unknown function (DUF397)
VESESGNWRRARRCESAGCVEVARLWDLFAVRDSKQPTGPVLTFAAGEWRAFVAGVRAGEFDH